MAKAVAAFEGGIIGLKQAAVREDGAVFVRYQDKTPYGYRWSAWTFANHRMGDNEIAAIPEFRGMHRADHINSSLVKANGEVRVRLP